jgi:hypothetical protein
MDPKEHLTDWLLKDRDYRRKHRASDGYYYSGISDFVLQHGVWYSPIPFPAGIRKGRSRYCFLNAALKAIEERQSFKYVEGYALYPKMAPVHHAWNLDGDGKLFDRTWKNGGTAYLGVVFSTTRATTADRWCYGVFNNPDSILKEPWTGE